MRHVVHDVTNNGVMICINDVTMESADELVSGSSAGTGGCGLLSAADADSDCDEMSIEFQKRQRRRSSWCPEEGRKVEEKKEQKRMLAVSGRR